MDFAHYKTLRERGLTRGCYAKQRHFLKFIIPEFSTGCRSETPLKCWGLQAVVDKWCNTQVNITAAMTLHKKTLVVLGIASLFLICSLSVIVIQTLLGNFKQLEGQHVLNNLSRAQKALSAEISQLHRLNADWACW
ncbi:MAG: hypothetical protein GY868_19640, partial [Deltaproteobacteria bacterium]|nr:hypothetical protein [Deltaproteobacteria bacterium]